MRVIGLMSGTSLDGIDACLVDVHGAGTKLRWRVLRQATYAYPEGLREAVVAQLTPARSAVDALSALDVRIGEAFADAARRIADEAGVGLASVDLVGSHGQTLWHAPTGPWPSTTQLGRGAVIAVRTGVTTVSDFRPADVALGGQGAPLVPYVDRLLFAGRGRVAIQNMGGIGNVTYLDGERVVAFDTGPGNNVIDALVQRVSNGAEAFDRDGRRALAGRVDHALVTQWLAADMDYLHAPPPKSTGRERYDAAFAGARHQEAAAHGVDGDDLIATATAWTAETVADAYRRHLGGSLEGLEVLIAGGGAANPALMAELARRLAPARVASAADAGVDPGFKEALAFALLAYQCVHGEPNGLPSATGASEPWVLGSITPGRNFARAVLAPPAVPAATEAANPESVGLDALAIPDTVALMHAQDWDAVRAIGPARPAIAALVAVAADRLGHGGRLFYVGAGTSGRLGVLDASECPPTFSADPAMVQGVIAGGEVALTRAVEGAEDDAEAGAADLVARGVGPRDVVVGISANGGAPYVRGALEAARAAGATTAIVTCNPLPAAAFQPDHVVHLPTGPEIVAGSTRLKAGTATKLALNMISTLTMVALGKVYDNLMVDVQVSNKKLRLRATRLVAKLTGLDEAAAGALLDAAGGKVKLAAVMHRQGVDAEQARALLAESGGFLRPWMRVGEPTPPKES